MFFIQTDSISHFQRVPPLVLFLLFTIQPLPHLPRVGLVHIFGCHADTSMKGSIVTAHEGRKRAQVTRRVVGGHVTIESLFERAVKSFHHTGFGISRGGKMMHCVVFQHSLHVTVVKFLPVVRLEFLGYPLVRLEKSGEGRGHQKSRLLFERNDPGVFGKHVHHRQKVIHSFFVTFQLLHLHEIGCPLFVGSGDEHAKRRKMSSGWFVIRVAQLVR